MKKKTATETATVPEVSADLPLFTMHGMNVNMLSVMAMFAKRGLNKFSGSMHSDRLQIEFADTWGVTPISSTIELTMGPIGTDIEVVVHVVNKSGFVGHYPTFDKAVAHALGAYEQIRNEPALALKKPVKKNKVKA